MYIITLLPSFNFIDSEVIGNALSPLNKLLALSLGKWISFVRLLPFSDEKFKEVVTKAVHNIKRSSRLEKDEKYIMVQTAGSHIKIFLRDIVYAEVYNRKVIIHTRSTDIEYYGKLQELSDMAGTDFFRTHRAYLVHFKYVEKYDATCVTMKNGTALIAKKNYPEFVRRYLKYNQRKGNEVR